jgi:hypothetical protein
MRRTLINLHLYAAAFLAPMFLLVAISGGLYLIGNKGSVDSTELTLAKDAELDPGSASLEDDIRVLLEDAGVEFSFEYVKVSGNSVTTRPTSRTHFVFSVSDGVVAAVRNEPNLQKSMIELHKGHGPTLFKEFQKVLAVGLLFVVLSGMWLGISSKGLRLPTLAVSGAGLVLFVILAVLM